MVADRDGGTVRADVILLSLLCEYDSSLIDMQRDSIVSSPHLFRHRRAYVRSKHPAGASKYRIESRGV